MKIIGLNENNQVTPFIELGDILVLDDGKFVMQIVQTGRNPEKYNALTLKFLDKEEKSYVVDCFVAHDSPLDVYNSYLSNEFKIDIVKANRLELHIK